VSRRSAGSGAAVAATGSWTDPDGVRLPAGEVHAWLPGRNETVCGLSLYRSELTRFPHVPWTDAQPESGGSADAVRRVCGRCKAATGLRRRPCPPPNPRP
jgi:hypothetical protein